jgi:hypothetical protein
MKIAFLLVVGIFLILSGSSCGQLVAENKDSVLRILVYGLPNFERQNSEALVAHKYGFRFFGAAGCVVTKEFEDSVERENKPVYALIEKKHGKGFWKRFNSEVDEEFKKQQDVEKLLWSQPYLKKKDEEMQKEDNGLDYWLEWTKDKNIYNVKAYGWGKDKGGSRLMVFYKLKVDLGKRKVVLVSDKQEPFE